MATGPEAVDSAAAGDGVAGYIPTSGNRCIGCVDEEMIKDASTHVSTEQDLVGRETKGAKVDLRDIKEFHIRQVGHKDLTNGTAAETWPGGFKD